MRSRAQAGARDTLPLQDLTQPLRIAAMGSAELTQHTGLQSRPADARVQADPERHGVRRGRRAGRSLAVRWRGNQRATTPIDSSRRMTRSVVGFKGDLPSLWFGRDFRWELSHTLARTTVNLNTEGLVNTSNLYCGLRVEADPANPGQFRCTDPGARAQGCVPMNPFADYTPAMKQALRIGSMAIGASWLNDTILTLSGTVADLPAGAMRAAAGAERRTFSGYLDRDVVVNNALATGNQISDTDFAKTKASEIFAEVSVPVLADMPFAKSLNLEGAVRKSDIGANSYNTWNFGGDWEPITGLRIRAKQARAVRAPLPGELSGIGQTFGVMQDPCTAARCTANPTRAANWLCLDAESGQGSDRAAGSLPDRYREDQHHGVGRPPSTPATTPATGCCATS